jgi:superfamily II DNA/RNA helicase
MYSEVKISIQPHIEIVHTVVFLQAGVLRHTNKIYIEGADAPPPLSTFADLAVAPFNAPAFLVKNITACHYDEPTPIQMQSIPILLSKRDMIACAPTGSGKTAAYLVPIFATLKVSNKNQKSSLSSFQFRSV